MKKQAILLTLVTLLFLTGCRSSEEKSSSVPPVSDVSQSSTAEIVEEKIKIGQVKNTDVGLNLRKEASADAEVLAVAPDDTYFILASDEKVEDWYKVKYKDTSAFVSAEFLEIKEVTAAEAAVLISGKEKAPETISESPTQEPTSSEITSSKANSEENPETSNLESKPNDGE
ncbi:SH3 domain-containing protein [Scatolibacter rhodanostii]|uniref:SH3 domain-containing protein n=1 Tax=Scatolibacter rhodanostii TaxID=2014781 RepID=UPI000C07A6BF|nr:SH3 domain-containing protein [Scatolibacter rhodanostii]